MTHSLPAIIYPVAIPLMGAFLLPIAARSIPELASALGRVTVLVSLAMSAWLASSVWASGPAVSAMGGFAAPLGIVFYADKLAMLFVLALNAAVFLFWPRGKGESAGAFTLMLTLLAGGSGLALSGDLFNIFVFYEITAVASYGLAASGGNKAGYAAAIRYLILGALGSTLALTGIALIYGVTGTLNLADLARLAPTKLANPLGLSAFLLLLLGFGVKAELIPVNSWVPEVYGAAPVRVTALLAGLVSKLAMVVILRFLVLAFPLTGAHAALLVIGMFGVIAGELAAWRAPNLTQTFSYSSIAQLGMVAMAFAISGPAGIAAGVALALHHAVVKPAFFMLADRWRGPVEGLAGAAKDSPLAAALFVLLSLSILGIPPLPGFWAKFLFLKAAMASPSSLVWLGAAVLLAGTVIEAAYLFRAVSILYSAPADKTPPARLTMDHLGPALALGAILLAAMIFTAPLGASINALAGQAGDAQAIAARVLDKGE